MSTQTWIIDLENRVKLGIEAVLHEAAREGTGKVYPENEELWASLAYWCAVLRKAILDRKNTEAE